MSVRQPTLWGDVWAEGGPLPGQYTRSLRTLLDAWEGAVLADSRTTPTFRAWVQEVVAEAHMSLDDGASAYYTLLLGVAPVFAAEDEDLVTLMPLTDEQIEAGQATLAAWADADE